MKILGIRGENLASLDGRFEIQLDEGPLGRAGLFAITGRTGAGKSTILDAMCLALFNKTPRLADQGGVPIGRQEEDEDHRVRASDVRGLLRRGKAHAWAEVDFRGTDARRYTARWAVRKARTRVDGRLQFSEWTLRDAAGGEAIGRTKTEVGEAIGERLGLTFDQFRRSVLLAQGDFDAFLRAGEKERSELLERMTGTEIYGRISMAAYRRAKEAKLALEQLEREVTLSPPLEAAAREVLETQSRRYSEELAALTKLQEEVEAALRWHDARARLSNAATEAKEALRGAERAWEEAESERRLLEAVEAVEPLRPLVVALDAAADEVEQSTTEAAETAQEAAGCDGAVKAAETEGRQATESLERARSAWKALQPGLAEARRLDLEITSARKALERAVEDAQATEGRLDAARRGVGALDEVNAADHRAAEEAERFLAASPQIERLVAEWTRWRDALERLARARELAQEHQDDKQRLLQALDEAADEVERKRQALEDLERALAEADDAAQAAEEAAAGHDATELRLEREALDEERERLRRRVQLLEEAQAARDGAKRCEEAAADACAQAAEATVREAALSLELETGQRAYEEAERALERARAALGLEERRAELEPGEPCPLCGSTEHPFAHGAGALPTLVKEAKDRVDTLGKARERMKADLLEAGRTLRETQVTQKKAAQEHAEFQVRLAALAGSWSELAAATELERVASLHEGTGLEALALRVRDIVARQSTIASSEAQGERLAKQARLAAKAAASARAERDGLREAHLASVAERAGAQTVLGKCEDELAWQKVQEDEARDVLAPLLASVPEWSGELDADARGFANSAEKLADEWKAQDEARSAARRRIEARKPELAVAQKEEANLEGLLDEQREACSADEAKLADHLNTRASVLSGEAADVAEARARDEEASAAKTTEAARAKLEEARTKAASAHARVEASGKRAGRAVRAHQEAFDDLRARLTELGVDLETAKARLELGADWRSAQRKAISELEKALAKWQTLLGERQQALASHDEGGVPELGFEEAKAEAERLNGVVDERRQALFAVQRDLSDDDRRQAMRAELLTRTQELTTEAKRWESLSSLIGSASGALYRQFVQSLTLEILMDYANLHLRELSGRYTLMRVPGHDLELQVVDGDMGDEVRSIQSLSGGETFLVSLAMALGLSSVAARDTRIESLFIDEGFGSLDVQTLDAVLGTLDALQATGRQVGLISHVQGIGERVGAQVLVESLGAGRSRVEVRGAA